MKYLAGGRPTPAVHVGMVTRRGLRLEAMVSRMDHRIVERASELTMLRPSNPDPVEFFIIECEETARSLAYEHDGQATFAVVNDVAWFFIGNESQILSILQVAAIMAS